MPNLQPYHVFRAEMTRLNALYWTSKYAYTRVAGLLKLISDTGVGTPDPRVDTIWPTLIPGEIGHTTRPLSDFVAQLEANAGSLRTTSILHMCSAFETALSNYYALCALYLPKNVDSSYKSNGVPEAFRNHSEYEDLKKWCIKKAGVNLHGKYTGRLQAIIDTFALPPLSVNSIANLNDYYTHRHLIAHDQSLYAGMSDLLCKRPSRVINYFSSFYLDVF